MLSTAAPRCLSNPLELAASLSSPPLSTLQLYRCPLYSTAQHPTTLILSILLYRSVVMFSRVVQCSTSFRCSTVLGSIVQLSSAVLHLVVVLETAAFCHHYYDADFDFWCKARQSNVKSREGSRVYLVLIKLFSFHMFSEIFFLDVFPEHEFLALLGLIIIIIKKIN